jgi:predicted nucleic acid-binding protein
VIVVADAGPLIYLSAVGLLHLLRDLHGSVLVPRDVYDGVRGTLGVLVEAKRRGNLGLVGPVLDQLVAADFRISATVRAEILRSAGE